jgi:predicted small metal-binding protein
MAKHVACGEIVPDCPFTTEAATEAELIERVKAHAAKEHGLTEMTPDLAARVKAAIQTR